MRARALRIVCLPILLTLVFPLFAQEGHPLTGTWTGDWGANATQRSHITLVLKWDGDNVTGVLNPGPDAVQLSNIFVDVTNWTVRLEGGNVAAEGQIDDIGAYRRTLVGKWRQGTVNGDFKVTRN